MPFRERTTLTSVAGSKVVSAWKRMATRLPWRSTAEMRRRSHMDLRTAYSKRFSTVAGRAPKRSVSSRWTSCFSSWLAMEEMRLGAQAEIFAGNVVFRDAHVEAQAERG